MSHPLQWDLDPDEILLWQGRPAPRCYVFRHWLQALVGSVLFLASSFWLMVGYQLVEAHGYNRWLLAVPGLLVLFSFLVGPGQIILARLTWEKVFLRPDRSTTSGASLPVREQNGGLSGRHAQRVAYQGLRQTAGQFSPAVCGTSPRRAGMSGVPGKFQPPPASTLICRDMDSV